MRTIARLWGYVLTASVLLMPAPGKATEELDAPGQCMLDDDSVGSSDSMLWSQIWTDLKPSQTLFITSPAVMDDATRTYDGCAPAGTTTTPNGVWSFGFLMTQLAKESGAVTDDDIRDFVENWMEQWNYDQDPNDDGNPSGMEYASARPFVYTKIHDLWPKDGNGQIIVGKAPFRLLAIVNRMDLLSLDTSGYGGGLGQGRFVFGLYDPLKCTSTTDQKLSLTVIFEFNLPCQTFGFCNPFTFDRDADYWASRWYELKVGTPADSDYRQLLQNLTMDFAGYGYNPFSLSETTVRSNEKLSTDTDWELREFKLMDGDLRISPVAQTPRGDLNNSQTLVNYINTNTTAIKAGEHVVPDEMRGDISKAMFADNSSAWQGSGINDSEARRMFGTNTCNGCHAIETGTNHTHVFPRKYGATSQLSGFLKGQNFDTFDFYDSSDPFTNEARSFNDIDCRALEFYNLYYNGVDSFTRVVKSRGKVKKEYISLHKPRVH